MASHHVEPFLACLLSKAAALRRASIADVPEHLNWPTSPLTWVGGARWVTRGDEVLIDAISGLGHPATHREATAERMFLHVLQGHCNSPIAGYARTEGTGELSLRAKDFTPDGKLILNAHEWAGRLDPATLGTSVAVALLRQGARELIDGIPH